jgi:hypothetical protein
MKFSSPFKKLLMISLSAGLSLSLLILPSEANEYSCFNQAKELDADPIWIPSQDRELKFTVIWAFQDPESCIVGLDTTYRGGNFVWSNSLGGRDLEFPAIWNLYREGENTYITAEGTVPEQLLQQYKNDGDNFRFSQIYQPLSIMGWYKAKSGTSERNGYVKGSYGLPQLWGVYLSKKQGGNRLGCKPFIPKDNLDILNSKLTLEIVKSGLKPVVKIKVKDDFDCIFLVHTGPLTPTINPQPYEIARSIPPDKLNESFAGTDYPKTHLAQYAFWSKPASIYWNSLVSDPKQVLRVGTGDFAAYPQTSLTTNPYNKAIYSDDVDWTPIKSGALTRVLNHSDVVTRNGSTFEITTTIESTDINPDLNKFVTFYVGYYWWYRKASSGFSAGWTVTTSGSRVTATYSKGGSLPGGAFMAYTTRAIKILATDLFISAEDKAAAELKVKQEAEAKAAAELKAKQDAEAKAAAEKIISDAKAEAARILVDAKTKAAVAKKTTITCVKGTLTKKVTAIKPKCPTGYKLKK